MYCNTKNSIKTMVCGVVINSLKITCILQPALTDVKIGSAHAHGIAVGGRMHFFGGEPTKFAHIFFTFPNIIDLVDKF